MSRPRSGSSAVADRQERSKLLLPPSLLESYGEGFQFVDNDKEKQPKEQPQNWQQRTKRRLTPKKQLQKTMEVFLDENVRDGIKALAIINNMPAQDFAEHVLAREVELNDSMVKKGLTYLEEANGNITSARLKYLEEKANGLDRAGHGF